MGTGPGPSVSCPRLIRRHSSTGTDPAEVGSEVSAPMLTPARTDGIAQEHRRVEVRQGLLSMAALALAWELCPPERDFVVFADPDGRGGG
jgi:hypothetical protein